LATAKLKLLILHVVKRGNTIRFKIEFANPKSFGYSACHAHAYEHLNVCEYVSPYVWVSPCPYTVFVHLPLFPVTTTYRSQYAKQLFANAMVGAGLAEDPRMLLTNMNTLLSRALEKY